MMQLFFLMEKRYAPYSKWFGTAFQELDCAATMHPLLWRVQQSVTWEARMNALADAYVALVQLHNLLGITPTIAAQRQQFFTRPFTVIFGGAVAKAIAATITDSEVKAIMRHGSLIGNIDQFSDNTDLREHTHWRERVKHLYESDTGQP